MNFVTSRWLRASVGGLAVLAALSLAACSEAGPEVPVPAPALPAPLPAESAMAPASGASTSVPAAASVFTPGMANKVEPATTRSNKTMSRAEESTAMPLPGQNNDHSAPLPPAKRASGS